MNKLLRGILYCSIMFFIKKMANVKREAQAKKLIAMHIVFAKKCA
jgi:hypothetical protein